MAHEHRFGKVNLTNLRRVVLFLVPAVVAISVAIAVSSFETAPVPPSAEHARQVLPGRDYYVIVSLAELKDLDDSGKPWDSYSDTGPDIYVEIFWRGTRVYRSTTKDDTFIAKWSNAELSFRDMALHGQRASLDDAIRGARINITEGESVEVRVYDDDTVTDTLAGSFTIETTKLELGETSYSLGTGGLKRLVLRVGDMSEPVDVLK